MANLGDFFSDDLKNKFATQNIKPGAVIKCFVKNTNPPKEKRFIILGIDETGNLVGSVFINSHINWNVIKTQELAQLQHYVKKDDNDYLDWDSYVDCSELIELPHADIVISLRNNPKNVLGNVTAEDFKEIKANVIKSPKIRPKVLKKYKLI
jgi:hypothetical protein